SQALAGKGVDARVWRCRHGPMALCPQSGHELGSNEPSAADDDEFHDRCPFLSVGDSITRSVCRYDRVTVRLVTDQRSRRRARVTSARRRHRLPLSPHPPEVEVKRWPSPIVAHEFMFGGQPIIDILAIPPSTRLVEVVRE